VADLTLHEYAGLVRYRVYEMLGWNIKAQSPGALQTRRAGNVDLRKSPQLDLCAALARAVE
jgi:hypothetical protein